MARRDPKIALAGTVKETGLDDDGLTEFHQSYFDRHTIYNDEKWQLYNAMGGKNVGAWHLFKATFSGMPRWNKKGISSSANKNRTDPWMIGGVLVFDKKGNLVYAMEETIGEEFSMARLQRAIGAARTLNQVEEVTAAEASQSEAAPTQRNDNHK